MTITHNFIFTGPSTMDEVRGTLRLAELAVESIYGHDRVHLETHASLDERLRCCAIDTSSKVGRVLATVFAGFIRQEFGSDGVRVQRITTHHHHDSIGGEQ